MQAPKELSTRGSIKLQKKEGQYKIPDQYWISQGFAGMPLKEQEAKDVRYLLVEHLPYTTTEAFEFFFKMLGKLLKTLFTGRSE